MLLQTLLDIPVYRSSLLGFQYLIQRPDLGVSPRLSMELHLTQEDDFLCNLRVGKISPLVASGVQSTPESLGFSIHYRPETKLVELMFTIGIDIVLRTFISDTDVAPELTLTDLLKKLIRNSVISDFVIPPVVIEEEEVPEVPVEEEIVEEEVIEDPEITEPELPEEVLPTKEELMSTELDIIFELIQNGQIKIL